MRSTRLIPLLKGALVTTVIALVSGCSNNETTTAPAGGGGGGTTFSSGTMVPGESFPFTFPDSGVTNYRCGVHPTQMTGYSVRATATSTVDSVLVNIVSVSQGMSVDDVTIRIGGKVRWVNTDGMNHSVETYSTQPGPSYP